MVIAGREGEEGIGLYCFQEKSKEKGGLNHAYSKYVLRKMSQEGVGGKPHGASHQGQPKQSSDAFSGGQMPDLRHESPPLYEKSIGRTCISPT